ncbi:MFS transporter [Aeromicrobium alkaliterrae]|uniref:MFS transporter n=1 Tax=Aeromicrobium alkaliterrae TaxID=302168 RepID=A0ABP4W2Z2_9ACTN
MSPRRGSVAAWSVVGGVALIMAVGAGVGFYGSTIYVAALTDAPRSFSVVTVSIATGGFMLVSGLGGILVARTMERFGPRSVLVGGTLVMGGAVAALGRVDDEASLLVVYALMGIGFAAMSVVPTGRLVAAWFTDARRNVAMSVAFMGLPIGGVIGTPVIAHLVETRGFAEATVWLAVVLVGVAVPTGLLLREPRDHGATPSPTTGAGAPVPPDEVGEAAQHAEVSVPAAVALRTPWFAMVTLGLALGMVSQIGVLTHLFSAVSDVRDAGLAAATVSTVTFASLVGRIAGSWALGRIGLLRSAVGLLAGQAVALIGIASWRESDALFVTAVLLGLTVGNMQVIQPLLLVDRFGPAEFPRILAVGNLFVTVGMAVGPLVVGLGVDLGSGYGFALLVLAACSLVAGLLVTFAGLRDRPTPER